jgi:copper chaperone
VARTTLIIEHRKSRRVRMFRISVPDMTCGGCVRRVTNAIRSVDPAADVTATPATREVTIATHASEQAVLTALAEAGYPAERNSRTAAA